MSMDHAAHRSGRACSSAAGRPGGLLDACGRPRGRSTETGASICRERDQAMYTAAASESSSPSPATTRIPAPLNIGQGLDGPARPFLRPQADGLAALALHPCASPAGRGIRARRARPAVGCRRAGPAAAFPARPRPPHKVCRTDRCSARRTTTAATSGAAQASKTRISLQVLRVMLTSGNWFESMACIAYGWK